MLKRKLQDLTVCCSYQVDFLHQKAHSAKEFKRQYKVLEEIGRGGFGIVYKATRICDNLPVAVKFVEHKHVREWTMTCHQLIPTELCHLETCRDVNGVIELIDWFANTKGFLIVMERPPLCMDMFDLVSAYGRLDETTARGLFTQVIDAVTEMYTKHGLVHRDLKDENLIVNMQTGEVKLVDFGATAPANKAMKKEFQDEFFCSNYIYVPYCPPEWFRQLQYLPMEATSWSLGVLLYILVTGQLPFRNEIQICLGRVKFPSYLSKEVCHLIKSCLTTACSTRATLAQIKNHSWMQHPLETFTLPFQQVLDMRLGKVGCSRVHSRSELEEDRQINDVMIMSHQRDLTQLLDDKSVSVSSRTASAALLLANELPTDSYSVPHTRLSSRYDNISASSLADYLSVASLETNWNDCQSEANDLTSIATTSIYHSTNDLDDDSSCLSVGLPPVKSASGYNLARLRKRSLLFKSFELDPVEEQESQPCAGLSSTRSEDQALSEDVNTDDSNPPIMMRPSRSSCSTGVRAVKLRDLAHKSLANPIRVAPVPDSVVVKPSTSPPSVTSPASNLKPMSRMRPLMTQESPNLRIFEVPEVRSPTTVQ
ncbi:hypothetical protein WR25_11811 [Diploscapter pachys]|uniref:Serine/threonine-protein kinase 1 n=1 Tax=Diploscapter pachys TaxID=2018661 RepID=A0A2A2KLQ1_9BILA|nr:hypothetical protein WR25_11811 [Diploscapter pachys]